LINCTPYPSKCAGEAEKILITVILIGSENVKTHESIFLLILELFYVCQSDRNIFYAALNQIAVRFNVPIAIQNTAHFESVNERIVPTTPGQQFEHIKRLIKLSLKHIVVKRYKNRCRAKDIQTVHRQVMPSSAEKSRERVKRWKKENPEKYKEQRKRYNRKHANANYERLKKTREPRSAQGSETTGETGQTKASNRAA